MATRVKPYQLQNQWYEELGRATASGGTNPTSLTVSFTAKKHLKILLVQHSGGVSLDSKLRFNTDSGNNYDWRIQENGAADSGVNGQNGMQLGINTLDGMNGELSLVNEAAYVKAVTGFLEFYASGAGAIYRNIVGFKWNNASNQINVVQMVATSGAYRNGSELIILGRD